ncbi:hypothetical protein IB633_02730 [Francisella philomiragia]|uniref:Conserved hypothetical membrane protein n=1 Tax=Francisella philomiragia subsp. philomiragia (strain ATCC 25017 / CCUG 19701 / FSC 153 / O\|nr:MULTISPECIES: hypothetical protein [Francisella]AJI46437.1 hypothetical protein BF30_952 [Francisella philomiragia]AJI48368.1 hypothetical protein KU46_603 [Francisella philomiragia]MBK2020308.1 hypothetical protein [Francisella philomiragia]MBK2030008.1 hypothetical protein [Francisella philomiragia]MBK2263867.1 hypothetical protein [Francisella philomiragia]
MLRIYSYLILIIISLGLCSCRSLSDDKFVYLGHGPEFPKYQLYYDNTRELFILVDKQNGCYAKDNSGTCMAFTTEEAEKFRKNVLEKMIEIQSKVADDHHGQDKVNSITKTGTSVINKQMQIEETKVTPVKQVFSDHKQQYLLVNQEYKISANIIAKVVNDNKNHIKLYFTVNIPSMDKMSITKPFIIEPEFLYNAMRPENKTFALETQKNIQKNNEEMNKEISDYLDKIKY